MSRKAPKSRCSVFKWLNDKCFWLSRWRRTNSSAAILAVLKNGITIVEQWTTFLYRNHHSPIDFAPIGPNPQQSRLFCTCFISYLELDPLFLWIVDLQSFTPTIRLDLTGEVWGNGCKRCWVDQLTEAGWKIPAVKPKKNKRSPSKHSTLKYQRSDCFNNSRFAFLDF